MKYLGYISLVIMCFFTKNKIKNKENTLNVIQCKKSHRIYKVMRELKFLLSFRAVMVLQMSLSIVLKVVCNVAKPLWCTASLRCLQTLYMSE